MEKEKRSAPAPPRKRFFFVRTYLCQRQLDLFLKNRSGSIEHYAYCYHDKDEGKEPHVHIVLRTKDARTSGDVQKWFSGFHDEKGKEINSSVLFLDKHSDVVNAYEYLIHATAQCEKELKYRYDDAERIVDSVEYWSTFKYEPNHDTLKEAVERLLIGDIDLVGCAREYGRDFILHYGHIRQLVLDIKGGK